MPAFILSALYVTLTHLSLGNLIPATAQSNLLVYVGIAAILAVAAFNGEEWPIWRHQVFVLLLGLMASIALSRMLNGWIGGGILGVWQYLRSAVVLVFVGATATSLTRLAWLRNLLLMIAVGFSIAGLVDLFRGVEDSLFIFGTSWADEIPVDQISGFQRLRGVGTLNDPNDFAQFLLVSLALLGGRTHDESSFAGRLVRRTISVILLTGLAYTRSRGGYLGLLALVVLAMWDRFRWHGVIPVAALGLAAAPFVSVFAGRDLTLEGGGDRLALWSDALGAIKHAPLFGNGFGSAPDLLDLTTHNTYLLCLVELGMVGFLFWIGMVIVVTAPLWKLASKPDGERAGGAAIQSWARAIRNAIVAFLVTSFFLSRGYQALFLVLVGMAFAIVQIRSQVSSEAAEAVPMKRWMPLAGAAAAVSLLVPYMMIRVGRL